MFAEEQTLEGLVSDWRLIGGTLKELVGHYEHHPDAVRDLAACYDLNDSDLQKLVELAEDTESKEGNPLDRAIEMGLDAGLTKEEIKKMYLEVRREVEAELSAKVPTTKSKRRAASPPVGGGKKRLPEKIRPHLEQWLEAGRSAKDFFELNEDILGDPAQYDLTEFVETDREWMKRVTDA